ncbi:ABC transporter ATP-binding protein [Haloarcula argentinensis]|uniref:Molybdate/tungstate import ATP-binding protein WtpC n=1 Tax=Haloarcula argentinensis TaxID=43776 RepID=A0ABU2EY25_HALAR|nr:ABC transporter ATP-binding protein [Haloarcula argentinensis]EMA23663.1 spermidine/putrescine ABC transporter ATP-binding protein [Haloarcula argentinensis DSM 12282]MDS0252731.1 ABC transporter ATP-binding protein [Haloarcula argentinensis]
MNRTGPPAVELDGVTRHYGETTAVEDLSLAVREGEFFTLVGPSGCGKTTTLRLIAGFEDPTQGEVRFGGTSVTGVPPEDRDVGVVFQNYALFPHMTVGENIAYGLSFTDPPGGGSAEARVQELLELVDLGGMADRDPDTLSGGQQQRVAMARALAPGPDVLLLDEPMSALDAKLRERLRVQVREIQQELGITTIYVTHDQEEALAVSDRVAVMRDGTPEQVAPPRTIYREPATEFVATFVGDNNVLSGAVTAVRSTDAADADSGQTIADVTVDSATLSVALGADSDPTSAVSPGDRLTFCVRPERLAVDADRNPLTATVTSAEFLGETTRVHLDWEGRELLLRAEDPPTDTVAVGFAPTDAHIVDRRS